MRSRLLVVLLAVGVAIPGIVPAGSVAAPVVNGGFETGDLTGWTVANEGIRPTVGNWFVYTGTSFGGSFELAAPPEGDYAAVTIQGGQGSHLLYQDVALEAGFSHTLSLYVYYDNRSGFFFTAPTLDWFFNPNQQYRIDILRPTAPVFSVSSEDVLARVFQTEPGDPVVLAPTRVSFDLSAFAGTTVRIRFAEVDNDGNFFASTDDVAIASTPLLPTSKDQCRNGGWRDFGVFKNQGDCISFVATGGKNPPGH